jgi:hypothetical protein
VLARNGLPHLDARGEATSRTHRSNAQKLSADRREKKRAGCVEEGIPGKFSTDVRRSSPEILPLPRGKVDSIARFILLANRRAILNPGSTWHRNRL